MGQKLFSYLRRFCDIDISIFIFNEIVNLNITSVTENTQKSRYKYLEK